MLNSPLFTTYLGSQRLFSQFLPKQNWFRNKKLSTLDLLFTFPCSGLYLYPRSYSEGCFKNVVLIELVMLATSLCTRFYRFTSKNSKFQSSKHIDDLQKITKKIGKKNTFFLDFTFVRGYFSELLEPRSS